MDEWKEYERRKRLLKIKALKENWSNERYQEELKMLVEELGL